MHLIKHRCLTTIHTICIGIRVDIKKTSPCIRSTSPVEA
ncbi:hypothetical protein MNB_SUP05-SYMBIONT-7-50 [hydrothermal vent metagenome]|uniref:Uncharacterized protein n=1 Tax=hydrothermal vent metagenome TaxID=652676 RepID=A0A1W1E5G1_9ZZZZ